MSFGSRSGSERRAASGDVAVGVEAGVGEATERASVRETQGDRWKRVAPVAVVGAASGVAGWALENAFAKLRGHAPIYSVAFAGRRVPFLPVHAVGGATVATIGPALKNAGLPWAIRGATYALLFGGLEVVACKLDRAILARSADADREASWNYGDGEADASIDGEGCVDESHAVAWGVLGLIAERFATRLGTGFA